MRPLIIFLVFLSLISCKNEDDTDCGTINTDGAFNNIFINLINSDGDNLIENNTYIADDIVIVSDDFTITNVVLPITGIENFITLNIFGEQGNNTFDIQLSDNETDTLILNLDRIESEDPCGLPSFTLNSALYNSELQTLEEDDNGDFLITITK